MRDKSNGKARQLYSCQIVIVSGKYFLVWATSDKLSTPLIHPVSSSCTNNGLEATNAWIKREHSLRKRLPVGQFLCKLEDLLAKWSKNRDPTSPNYTEFCCRRTITLPHWTRAYQWAQENRKVLQRRGRSCVQYFTAASGMPPISTATLKDENAKTFDEFRKLQFGTWVMTIFDEGAADSSLCSCQYYSCPYFLKITFASMPWVCLYDWRLYKYPRMLNVYHWARRGSAEGRKKLREHFWYNNYVIRVVR